MKKRNKNIRSEKRSRSAVIGLICVGMLVLAGGVLLMDDVRSSKDNTAQGGSLSSDSSLDIERKYLELLRHISITNVCPGITPVHIFREVNGQKFLHATGGQLAGDGNILTCGHAFWNIPGEHRVSWKFYYQVLQPYEKAFHSINRLMVIDRMDTNTLSASKDVMACVPGNVELIAPITPPYEGIVGKTLKSFDYYTPFEQKRSVRSTLTGENGYLIGFTKLSGGPHYFVLDCDSFPSQSGTLYVSDNNNTVYIVSKSVKLNPALRKLFKLDDSHTGVTFCSSVNIR